MRIVKQCLALCLMAFGLLGCGGGSGPAAPTLTAPTHLTADLYKTWGSIILSWTGTNGSSGYLLETKRAADTSWKSLWRAGSGGVFIDLTTTYPDLQELDSIDLQVTALDSQGQKSPASNTMHFTVPLRAVDSIGFQFIESLDAIRVNWHPASTLATSFSIYRFDSAGQQIFAGTAPGNMTTYDDVDFIECAAASYTVIANHDTLPGYAPQSYPWGGGWMHAPYNVQATPGPGRIVLGWASKSQFTTSIQVLRTPFPVTSTSGTSGYVLVATLPAGTTTFSDTVPFGVYGYCVVNLGSFYRSTSAQAFAAPLLVSPDGLSWQPPETRILPNGMFQSLNCADSSKWIIQENSTTGRILVPQNSSWIPIAPPSDLRGWIFGSLTIAPNGDIHCLYTPAGSDYYYPPLRHGVYSQSNWTTTQLGSSVWSSGPNSLLAAPSGKVWAAWQETDRTSNNVTSMFQAWENGLWGAPEVINVNSALYGNPWSQFQLFPDAAGQPVLGLVWTHESATAKNGTTGWELQEFPNPDFVSFANGAFAADSAGYQVLAVPMISLGGNGMVQYDNAGGTWSSPAVVFGTGTGTNSSCTPIKKSPDGTQLAYCISSGPTTYVLRLYRGGVWTSHFLPAQVNYGLSCDFDERNKLFLIWKIDPGLNPYDTGAIQTAVYIVIREQ